MKVGLESGLFPLLFVRSSPSALLLQGQSHEQTCRIWSLAFSHSCLSLHLHRIIVPLYRGSNFKLSWEWQKSSPFVRASPCLSLELKIWLSLVLPRWADCSVSVRHAFTVDWLKEMILMNSLPLTTWRGPQTKSKISRQTFGHFNFFGKGKLEHKAPYCDGSRGLPQISDC